MSEEENKASENEETGFKVSDRRKFSADGELLDSAEPGDSPSETEAPPADETKRSAAPEAEEAKGRTDSAEESHEESIDFASFILSLATTSLAHLGEIPDPATGEKTENLPAAKQMIDILSILEAKTKGNLEPDEERLLENLLYELRMKYLNQAKIITV
jgi:hypothetical protein